MHQVVHVAVAVIKNTKGEVLIARRAPHVHKGGYWEFPGGKLEKGETVFDALRREIGEEVGLHVIQAQALIQIPFDYTDKQVLLDVWQVLKFSGQPQSCEGQDWRWVGIQDLSGYRFPEANRAIVNALLLPREYLVTPEPKDIEAHLQNIERAFASGIRLLQLRAKTLDIHAYTQLAQRVLQLADSFDAKVLLNSSAETAKYLKADGVHLSSRRLMQLQDRPLPLSSVVAASCHNENEINHAMAIGVDFIVLGPVLRTLSHPDAHPMGWKRFESLVALSAVPVYGLGGLNSQSLTMLQQAGAQGVAAIRGLWPQQA